MQETTWVWEQRMEWSAHLQALRYVYDCHRHSPEWEARWALHFSILSSDKEDEHRYTAYLCPYDSEPPHEYDYSGDYAFNDDD